MYWLLYKIGKEEYGYLREFTDDYYAGEYVHDPEQINKRHIFKSIDNIISLMNKRPGFFEIHHLDVPPDEYFCLDLMQSDGEYVGWYSHKIGTDDIKPILLKGGCTSVFVGSHLYKIALANREGAERKEYERLSKKYGAAKPC